MTLRQQLNQLDVTECMMGNRKTVRQNFDIAANRLAEILREVFKEYQQLRYEEIRYPLYERTGQLLDSIQVDFKSYKVSRGVMSIEVGFSKKGFHHSGDGLDGKDGRTLFYPTNTEPFDVATAMYEGYHTVKPWFSTVYTFGWRPQFGFKNGYDFMWEAIYRYMPENYLGLSFEVVVPEY